MKAAVVIRTLIAIILVGASSWVSWQLTPDRFVQADTQATITIEQPDGVNDMVGEGDDFATTVLGDPWDMSQSTDVIPVNDYPNASFSGGVFSYNLPTSMFGGVPLLLPAGSQVDAGKIGIKYPIAASRYRWLSLRMKQPAGTTFQVNWEFDRVYNPDGRTQRITAPTSGWQTYVIDLATYPKGAGNWTGNVVGLYLESFASSGNQISIDWARLTATNPAGNKLQIAWSGLSAPSSTVDFYLDSDTSGCDGTLIYTKTNASASGSFDWVSAGTHQAAPANVAPGAYYVCAKVGGSPAGYSSGRLRVNQAPIVQITQPSFTSGADYATDAGNAWDMNDAADLRAIVNGVASVQGGTLAATAYTTNGGDVQVYLQTPGGAPIDVSRYYYLTYRLKVDYPYLFYVDKGQFTRIFWGRNPTTETQSQLVYAFPGWQTYTVDLRTLGISNGGPAWAAANWTLFRFDPIANATGQNATFYMDDIRLTGDERADGYADIQWQLTDPDTTATTMQLYYDTNRSGFNGTLITTLSLTNGQHAIAASAPASAGSGAPNTATALTPRIYLPLVARNDHPACTGACYTWYTSSVPAGSYYLYTCVDDGDNQVCRYSDTPLIVSHS
ncbi:MAG TPA: hypothetical protein VJG32_11885 [Anaerolineae bacterium]|nr:hypothetical protein [Anaerolineae bacterium]